VQALAGSGAAPKLAVVTRAAQAVDPADVVDPAQAALWGLARTIRLEHPELQCVSIDLAADEKRTNPLAAELLGGGEAQIAYRAAARHVARLVRHAADVRRAAPTILDRGCYLITGGLGALGLCVARQLARQGARQLVLAGRSDRPIQPALEELRAAGVVVQVVQADVTRAEDVARLIDTCQARGPLRGIVHAAGVLDDGILENQTPQRFARVMAPKASGAWRLHVATQAKPLDFFVCFSSMASLLGSAGQAPYAAANAFLDGLAHLRRSRGLPALTLNWGPWADAGMAAGLHSRLQAHGEKMIDPALGMRLFGHALGQDAAQLGVMHVDWAQFAGTYPGPEFLERLVSPAAAKAATPIPDILDRLRAAPAGQRAELLTEFVQQEAAAVLGHPADAVSRTTGFAQMGMDSLGAIDLRTRLEWALQCRLPTTLAFDFPNIDALSARLGEQLAKDTALTEVTAATLPPATAAAVGNDELKDLSREELATLLARELSTVQEGSAP
jgi:short-subunit dehydrogenase/acyl carrier protein